MRNRMTDSIPTRERQIAEASPMLAHSAERVSRKRRPLVDERLDCRGTLGVSIEERPRLVRGEVLDGNANGGKAPASPRAC